MPNEEQPRAKYKILSYIPAEPEEEEIYESEANAMAEMEHLILMQPENHYEIVEVQDETNV